MGKSNSMDSGSSSSSSSEEEEENSNGDEKVQHAVASDYEKERLLRIAENRARMEAMGLRKMASSLTTTMSPSSSQAQKKSSRNKKSKAKAYKDDDDYRPEDERPQSSSGEEQEEEEDDDGDSNGDRKPNCKAKAKKMKKLTVPKSNKNVSSKKVPRNSDYIDDDDEAFKMAIALSLRESGVSESSVMAKGTNQSPGDSVKNKRKKPFSSRIQMTQDELILHFYQFDENWNDGISMRDLERVANQHDFTWTDKELSDMIRFFDSDGDGKISLDDFTKIARRCKMIEGSQDN